MTRIINRTLAIFVAKQTAIKSIAYSAIRDRLYFSLSRVNKLKKTKSIKQGMMQVLLTGRTRLL